MRTLFLLLGVAAPLMAWSQNQPTDDRQADLLGKGSLNVGVGIGGGYGYTTGMTLRAIPRLQYFLADGWSVALEGRFSSVYEQSRYVGGGLSTRYYFIRDRRLALFGQLGATYGQYCSQLNPYNPADPLSIYRGFLERKNNAVQVGAGLGVHYRVARRWSLEAVVESSHTNIIGLGTNTSQWQVNLGVNFRLKR